MPRSMLIVALLILGLAGCGKKGGSEPSATEPQKGPGGELMLQSVHLAQLYATDPAAFDATFRNKLVILEGVVEYEALKDTQTGSQYVTLKGYEDPEQGEFDVRCLRTGSFETEVRGLAWKEKIMVRGRCQPYQPNRSAVVLTECSLVTKR